MNADKSPWAIPVAEVSARPGQSKEIDVDMPAPSGIGDDVIGIPESTDVTIEGRFDTIVDGLVFTGTLRTEATGECARCLKPLSPELDVPVNAFFPFAPDPRHADQHGGKGKGRRDEEEVEIIAGEDEGGDTYPLSPDGAFADLEALLRDNLVEALPLTPLCSPDCLGLCPRCGVNLNDEPDHTHDETNFRWSALADLKAQLEAKEAGQQGE